MSEDYAFLACMTEDELHSFAEKNSKKYHEPISLEEQVEWAWNLLMCGTLDHMCTTTTFQAIDGCTVDIDGNCEHGNYSPMVLTRMIHP